MNTPTADSREDLIFETDIAPSVWDETDPHDTLTLDEWLLEFESNICCPNSYTAAHRMCGCGGSGELPANVSRIIRERFEEAEEAWMEIQAENRAEAGF